MPSGRCSAVLPLALLLLSGAALTGAIEKAAPEEVRTVAHERRHSCHLRGRLRRQRVGERATRRTGAKMGFTNILVAGVSHQACSG